MYILDRNDIRALKSVHVIYIKECQRDNQKEPRYSVTLSPGVGAATEGHAEKCIHSRRESREGESTEMVSRCCTHPLSSIEDTIPMPLSSVKDKVPRGGVST